MIEDIRICPFDLLPVVCDGNCEDCYDAEEDEEWKMLTDVYAAGTRSPKAAGCAQTVSGRGMRKMKLIEAKVAKDFAQSLLTDPVLRMAINAVVDNAPGFELVRCKECKHYVLHALACRNEHMNGVIGIDGFCSYGERKDNAE